PERAGRDAAAARRLPPARGRPRLGAGRARSPARAPEDGRGRGEGGGRAVCPQGGPLRLRGLAPLRVHRRFPGRRDPARAQPGGGLRAGRRARLGRLGERGRLAARHRQPAHPGPGGGGGQQGGRADPRRPARRRGSGRGLMGASRIISVGGGPAGLYFGILAKQADPSRHITIIERNRPNDTFGFGVVFSDATLENLARADGQTYQQIRHSFAHWDDIDIHWRGQVLRSTGHGFCGMERRLLLEILQARCAELGVELRFEEEVRDVRALAAEADLLLGADGVQSGVRQALRDGFEPDVDVRPNRFVWLGTTFPFQAFTFYFRENRHGLWRVHAYRYRDEAGGAADGPAGVSTFIVECTAETFARSG